MTHTDQHGRRWQAGDEALVAVLNALGVPVAGPGDAAEALRAADACDQRVIEPVLARRIGTDASHPVTLPAAVDPGTVRVTIHLEDGTVTGYPLSALVDPSAPSSPHRTGEFDRSTHTLQLPGMPDGYHRLVVEGPGIDASALVVAAPARCPQLRRGWGVTAPLHAVRTEADWGVATYRELAEVGEWVAGLGGSMVGTLPLFATFLEDRSADPSPYRPASRLAWNELYLDVDALPELGASPGARQLLESPPFLRERDRLRRQPLADPAATMSAKRQLLELLAAAVFSAGSARRRELEAFADDRPELVAYARFRAAVEAAGGSAGGPPTTGSRHWAAPPDEDPRVNYHLYVQWAADAQLAEAGRRADLYLDLPVGVHPAGFDPWWRPDAFVQGMSIGAPPDDFFAGGQAWGLTPPHPVGLRDGEYGPLIAELRHSMRHARAVRIDHVMRLRRLWYVPDGMDPNDGVYVHYRADEMRAVVVLEAARAGVSVVGEDLGTVPPAVRTDMRRDGMLRSHVFQFAATPDDPLPVAPSDAVASLGTHDLPTFAAWWVGTDSDDREDEGITQREEAATARRARAALRKALGETRAADALRACLAHLASGPARLVLVDPADLWGEQRPQNRPGTGASEPNFRLRWTRLWPDDLRPPDSPSSMMLRSVDRSRRGEGDHVDLTRKTGTR
ncbi:MAG: 4-alpha-glucanotransferase [Acidimicrobiales bacterium]